MRLLIMMLSVLRCCVARCRRFAYRYYVTTLSFKEHNRRRLTYDAHGIERYQKVGRRCGGVGGPEATTGGERAKRLSRCDAMRTKRSHTCGSVAFSHAHARCVGRQRDMRVFGRRRVAKRQEERPLRRHER